MDNGMQATDVKKGNGSKPAKKGKGKKRKESEEDSKSDATIKEEGPAEKKQKVAKPSGYAPIVEQAAWWCSLCPKCYLTWSTIPEMEDILNVNWDKVVTNKKCWDCRTDLVDPHSGAEIVRVAWPIRP